MGYSFFAYGHKNILATHKTTIEFTKDKELSLKGNCILGVKADFDLEKIKRMIEGSKRIRILIKAGDVSDEITAEVNPDFNDENEIVIRVGEFKSKRTLGVRADKGAAHVKGTLKEKLKNPNQKIFISVVV